MTTFKARERYSFAYTDWRSVWGSKPENGWGLFYKQFSYSTLSDNGRSIIKPSVRLEHILEWAVDNCMDIEAAIKRAVMIGLTVEGETRGHTDDTKMGKRNPARSRQGG